MLDNIKNNKIILASQSPRRHHLLKELGLEFEIRTNSDFEENYPGNLENEQIVLYLASQKASYHYKNLCENEILITADTIVILEGKVLNKPESKSDAFNMLKAISGKKHTVLTGVCIKQNEKSSTFHAKTDVFFKDLSDTEINYYIDNYKPFDKAGAYGIQEWIGYIGIEKINGSYFNVMGLPVQKLYEELSKF